MDLCLDITTNMGCKVNCDYCPQTTLSKSYPRDAERTLTLINFKTFISTAPKEVEMCFCGFSEPWGNLDCTDLVEYAAQKGHPITLYTTLEGMSLRDAQRLIELKFRKFVIHLPDNKGEMSVRVNDKYLSVLRTLLDAKIPQLRLTLQTFQYPNTKLEPQVHELLQGYSYSVDRMFDSINSRAGNLKSSGVSPIKRIEGNLAFCPNMNGGLLLPNGDVLICSMDWGLRHRTINLKRDSFESYFVHQEYLRVIAANENESIDVLCRTCEYAEKGCHGKSVPLSL